MQRTIEEIKVDLYSCFLSLSNEDATNSMFLTNELIETVATLQREKCAEEAKIMEFEVTKDDKFGVEYSSINLSDVHYYNDRKYNIYKESILNAKL